MADIKDVKNKGQNRISITRVIIGSFFALLFVFIFCIILYYTGVVDMSPSGIETELSGSGVKITSYTGEDKNLVIPKTINGKPVIEIDSKVFYENDNIEKVTLPESLKKIGNRAFAKCSNLKEVIFNSDYTDCGEALFENSAIEKAVLPKRLQKIPTGMFRNCKYVTAVSFPDDLKIIGEDAFMGCKSIKSMIIGASVFKIGEKAFDNMGENFYLSSVIGSPTETYAIENNIEYNPCTSHYDMYTRIPMNVGTNRFNSKTASDNKRGVLTFDAENEGYYRITLYNGKGVKFKINSAIREVQECPSIRNNKNDFICYLERGKTYYFQVTAKSFTEYYVDVERVSRNILDTYNKCESHINGTESVLIKSGTELKPQHSKYSQTAATVNSDISLDKVLDYYIESDNKHIWYKINANVDSHGQQNLWFKAT